MSLHTSPHKSGVRESEQDDRRPRPGQSLRHFQASERGQLCRKSALIEGRKAFLVLCVRASAFAAGREEEEVRALWKAARQKVRVSRRKRRVRKHHKKQATGNMSIIPQCIDWLSARRFRGRSEEHTFELQSRQYLV